jgi:hypothetical protein
LNHTANASRGHKTRPVEEEKVKSAVSHVPLGEGIRSLWVFGELLIHKVPSQQTGGAYSLFEVATHPGAGPLPHVQHRED